MSRNLLRIINVQIEKIKVWAIVNGNENLFKMLAGQESIEEYLTFAESVAKANIQDERSEIANEQASKEPNKYIISSSESAIEREQKTLMNILKYRAYRNKAKSQESYG